MNAGEVVKLLEGYGIKRTESGIKYIAKKYNLYLPKTEKTPYPGLDPKKVKNLVRVLTSELLLTNIASTKKVRLSQVVYYINTGRIDTVVKYGRRMLKYRKDLQYVYKKLER